MIDNYSLSIPYTDSHAHLEHICARLGDAEVFRLLEAYDAFYARGERTDLAPFILDIGTKAGDLARRKEKFGHHPCVRFSAGLWPGKAAFDDIAGAVAALAKDAIDPDCVAIGECGLDYHHMDGEPSIQIELFQTQAELAATLGLPLIVHSRDAFEDTLKVVERFAHSQTIIIHCFSYGKKEALAFLEAGCVISFAGNLTYKKSEGLCEALEIVPLDRLLLETDSPYMNPMPCRGKSSTPFDIGRTVAYAADVRGIGCAELALQVHRNAFRIFEENAPAD